MPGNRPLSGPARPLDGSGTGDGTTTSFAIGWSPQSINHILIFIDGVKQDPTAYSISGSNCIFTTAPINGENIEFHGFEVGKDTVPQDNSVDASKMATGELPFSKSFISTEQTITSAGALTIPHGLAVSPILIQCRLICKTVDAGYAVDDEVIIDMPAGDAASNYGLSVVPDVTNINLRFGSQATAFLLTNKTTGAANSATNANWKLIVRAWA